MGQFPIPSLPLALEVSDSHVQRCDEMSGELVTDDKLSGLDDFVVSSCPWPR
jgi:hypothetical protein